MQGTEENFTFNVTREGRGIISMKGDFYFTLHLQSFPSLLGRARGNHMDRPPMPKGILSLCFLNCDIKYGLKDLQGL